MQAGSRSRLGAALLTAASIALLSASPAAARARRATAARGATAARQRTTASQRPTSAAAKELAALLGKYQWGASSAEVLKLLEQEVRAEFAPSLAETKEPLEQDRLRRKLAEAIEVLRKNYVSFDGQATPWDISLVDKEFAHRTGESLAVRWGKRDRRFYFFHAGRLWKIYIAFNSDLYQGKTFDDFAVVMERRFGPAERKFRTTIKGEATPAYLRWPPIDGTALRAIDNTQFFGNFCLAFADQAGRARVREARKLVRRPRQRRDALVESVLRPVGGAGAVDENVVDRLTGQVTAPTRRPAAR
ncbi:MAG: hypothetical protein IPL40_16435 [Proteobacteria bacterium]|nr:hypothetical protein [Pseudomonadota bacterium]